MRVCYLKSIFAAICTALMSIWSDGKGLGGMTLMDAIERMRPFVIEQLLESDKSEEYLKETLDDGSGPLHIACRISDSEDGYLIFQMLLKAGSCPNQVNKKLETPIHDSCYLKNIERRNDVIEDLLLHGARLLQEDISGKTIIERLSDMQSKKDLEGFLTHFGYLITEEDYKRSIDFVGKSAGEGRGFTDLAELLMKFAKEKKEPKDLGEIVLLGDLEKAKEALKKNQSLAVSLKEKRWGFSPLMIGLLKGDRGMVDLLIEKGSSLLAQDMHGRSPLHIISEGCIEISRKREFVRMLVKKGASKEQVDLKKRTPLSIGIKKGLEKELFEIREIKR